MRFLITITDTNTEKKSTLFDIEEFYVDSEKITAYNNNLEIAITILTNTKITIEVE